jgi:hypothetical protein
MGTPPQRPCDDTGSLRAVSASLLRRKRPELTVPKHSNGRARSLRLRRPVTEASAAVLRRALIHGCGEGIFKRRGGYGVPNHDCHDGGADNADAGPDHERKIKRAREVDCVARQDWRNRGSDKPEKFMMAPIDAT